ncbi:hypothetical protein ACTFIU_006009 [Dictyostelium citrinum]
MTFYYGSSFKRLKLPFLDVIIYFTSAISCPQEYHDTKVNVRALEAGKKPSATLVQVGAIHHIPRSYWREYPDMKPNTICTAIENPDNTALQSLLALVNLLTTTQGDPGG